jgi:hypothetical protein
MGSVICKPGRNIRGNDSIRICQTLSVIAILPARFFPASAGGKAKNETWQVYHAACKLARKNIG